MPDNRFRASIAFPNRSTRRSGAAHVSEPYVREPVSRFNRQINPVAVRLRGRFDGNGHHASACLGRCSTGHIAVDPSSLKLLSCVRGLLPVERIKSLMVGIGSQILSHEVINQATRNAAPITSTRIMMDGRWQSSRPHPHFRRGFMATCSKPSPRHCNHRQPRT